MAYSRLVPNVIDDGYVFKAEHVEHIEDGIVANESSIQDAVLSTEQNLSIQQQATACQNISANMPKTISANWCISSGNWSASNHCYIVPVKGKEHIRVVTNQNNVTIAGLRSFEPVASTAPDFSTYTSETWVNPGLPAAQQQQSWGKAIDIYNGMVFSTYIPEDVRFIYVYRGWGTAENRVPLHLYIDNDDIMTYIHGQYTSNYRNECENADAHTIFGNLNASQYQWEALTPLDVAGWNNGATVVPHTALIPIKPGDVIEILATDTGSNTPYAFLKYAIPTNGTVASMSAETGFNALYFLGKKKYKKLVSPKDAELLYVYCGLRGERKPVALLINGQDAFSTLKQNIVKQNSPTPFKIMQYNIGKYTWGNAQDHMQTEAVGTRKAFADYVTGYRKMFCDQHPDIICMQEYKPTTDVLVTGSSPAQYNTENMKELIFDPIYPNGHQFYYNGTYYELYMCTKYHTPLTTDDAWYSTTVSGETKWVTAIVSHYVIEGKIVCVICTGLPQTHGTEYITARSAILTQIMDAYANEEYCFIVLDMNNGGANGSVTSEEEGQSLLATAQSKGWNFAMGGYLPFEVTYKNTAQYYDNLKLDNIVYKDNGKTLFQDFKVLESEWQNLSSDHYPVTGEFLLV